MMMQQACVQQQLETDDTRFDEQQDDKYHP